MLVDSVTVGTEMNERLKCLSIATGGYAFHPTTMRAAMRLNELETVLSARQRVPREEKHEDQEDQEQMKEAGGGHGAGASARGKKRSPQGLTKQVIFTAGEAGRGDGGRGERISAGCLRRVSLSR